MAGRHHARGPAGHPHPRAADTAGGQVDGGQAAPAVAYPGKGAGDARRVRGEAGLGAEELLAVAGSDVGPPDRARAAPEQHVIVVD
ncbi:hypothetical protein DRA43_29485, partial [Micromonospora provocatoris]